MRIDRFIDATYRVALVFGAMVLAFAFLGCSRDAWLVPETNGPVVVARFAESWSGATGAFRVEGAAIDRSVVHVAMRSPRRSARLILSHRGFGTDFLDGERVTRADRDLAVSIACAPDCTETERAALRSLAQRLVDREGPAIFQPARGWVTGRERLIAWWTARLLWYAFVAIAVALLWRRRAQLRARAKEFVIAVVGTIVVTAILSEPALANWYANFSPSFGAAPPSNEMNGVAGLVFDEVLRAAVPWRAGTLFGTHLVLHGLAGGFLWLAFVELEVSPRAAWMALLVWALMPIPMRAGWSDAQHVLADLLFAIALFAWTRGVRTAGRLEIALALAAAATMARVRVESGVFVAALAMIGMCVRAPMRRRLVLLGLLVVVGAWSAWEVRALYIERFRMPAPALDAMGGVFGDFAWLRQFGRLPSGMPNWFPTTAAFGSALGLAALLVKRPSLALAIIGTFFVTQAALGRLVAAEGLVGGRYFLPLFPLLALAFGFGIDAAGERLSSRSMKLSARQRAAIPVVLAVVAATVLAIESRPFYRARYTFADEYRFLSSALARLPDGARVHYPSVHDVGVRNDPDCCLDLARSVLALDYPRLRFTPVPAGEHGFEFREAPDAPAYFYRSALCRLGATRDSERRNPGLADRVFAACGAVRAGESVAEGSALPVSTWPFFRAGVIHLELVRVTTP